MRDRAGPASRRPSGPLSSRAYFDTIGADWDRMREGFFPERVLERALAVAAVEAGRVAADIGAGTGFLTEGLLACGVHVIAVDQSPAMLEALRRKFPQVIAATGPARQSGRRLDPNPSPATLDCRAGEAEHLPIDDGAVDYCLANMFLHHVERPAAVIGEMARILRPGGIVVVTDLDAHRHTWLRDEHHDRWMGFERRDISAWFREAGLSDARVDDLGGACRATSTGGRDAAIGIFIASGRK